MSTGPPNPSDTINLRFPRCLGHYKSRTDPKPITYKQEIRNDPSIMITPTGLPICFNSSVFKQPVPACSNPIPNHDCQGGSRRCPIHRSHSRSCKPVVVPSPAARTHRRGPVDPHRTRYDRAPLQCVGERTTLTRRTSSYRSILLSAD